MQRMYVHPDILNFIEALEKIEKLDLESQKEYAYQHRRMVDVQHEIELSEGYDEEMKCSVFEHMKEISSERRKAKDTTFLIDTLKKKLQNGTDLVSLATLLQDAESTWDRHYFPRSEKGLDFSSQESLRLSRLTINKMREIKDEDCK
ncbi:hypothetical protein Sf13_gp102 [Shigella phage Sf13]|uniref:Uncharacterized protein n=1 Tax=Shigella phage Sf13 TaxID=2024316 RepID=A0A291AY02_9CAUD|nr:hypothetical protein FDI44_gp047 [Shigella phage Sf13]ATE85902.1 hypothetical protein Sf13_gp102 [Shigella phage Sf13]